jgi:hypothetical protein
MSFIERQITITIQLGKGVFGESGFDTVTLSGYRCSVGIDRAAMPFMGSASARVYGMPISVMNQLSTLGNPPFTAGRVNQITITAGDAKAGMFQIFQGIISNGYQDYDGMPVVCFVIEAIPGGVDFLKAASPTSFPGSPDVATILKGLAARFTPPLAFQNYGVSVQLNTPYLSGTLVDQVRAAIRAANITGEIYNGTLSIWPRNGSRPGNNTVISAATDLVGYPSFNGVQIMSMRTLFNPTLDFGQPVNLKSSLSNASGTWYVNMLSHIVESLTPGGAWFSEVSLASLAYLQAQTPN